MLEVYRSLARLRRAHPELTDPAFDRTRCSVDEQARFFTMSRGELRVLINFSDQPMATEVGDVELLFETEAGVDVNGRVLTLPAHAGALVRPRATAAAGG